MAKLVEIRSPGLARRMEGLSKNQQRSLDKACRDCFMRPGVLHENACHSCPALQEILEDKEVVKHGES
jgi:hypothetical protein